MSGKESCCSAEGGHASLPYGERITQDYVRRILPPRPDDAHKGTFGKALLIAGSERFAGAALLATAACLRAGAGITFSAVPAAIRASFFRIPEAICVSCGTGGRWDRPACGHAAAELKGKSAVAIGPGMGEIDSDELIEEVLLSGIPAVIDADAINHISGSGPLKKLLHRNVVITPHPAEMSRLSGLKLESILSRPAETAVAFSAEFGCVVLLKGSKSYIARGEEVYRNEAGDSSLSKGGSGDILTGIILGLLSQGLSPLDAACAGAYLLGTAGRNAETLLEKRMLLGRDVVSMIRETAEELRM